mmetsp:Transcript_28187/g.89782  ORF Transcript_28187/g.89782 Transcript_28187/m.89782 type:complete len:153 (-) Transcript_28187:127-585(-)
MVADLAPTPRGAPAVEDLLLWKDPKKSGVCLAACTGAYMLFEKSGFTLISLLCNIFLVFTCTAFLWANIAPMMNKCGSPQSPSPFSPTRCSAPGSASVAYGVLKGIIARCYAPCAPRGRYHDRCTRFLQGGAGGAQARRVRGPDQASGGVHY